MGEDEVTKAIIRKVLSVFAPDLELFEELPARGSQVKNLINNFNKLAASDPVILLTDLDEDESVPLNFRNIIGGDILVSSLVRRQLFYLLFLCILSIIYVTNRYAYQQDIIEQKRLTHSLEDRRLRAIVATSNLTEYTRRSNIEQHLTDTTIQSTSAPFYYLHTDMP